MKIGIVVPNHGRDISILKRSIPIRSSIELFHVNIGLERSLQRNIGIKAAKEKCCDAILILDSDQSISLNLIPECIELFKKGYYSIYIPEVIVAESFFGKIRKFEREFYTGTAIDVPRFVMASVCPEFDDTMSGPEDSDWGNRIEGPRAISTNVLYHHDDISPKEYFRKKAYYTKSMARYKEKWPECKCLDPWYRCVKVFIENGKWKKLLRHPILTAGIMFIVAVRGVIYVCKK